MKASKQAQNQYLDYLIDPSFYEVNRVFVLLFENVADRTVYTRYYFTKVDIKNYKSSLMEEKFLISKEKHEIKHTKLLVNLLLVKQIITQLVLYEIRCSTNRATAFTVSDTKPFIWVSFAAGLKIKNLSRILNRIFNF